MTGFTAGQLSDEASPRTQPAEDGVVDGVVVEQIHVVQAADPPQVSVAVGRSE